MNRRQYAVLLALQFLILSHVGVERLSRGIDLAVALALLTYAVFSRAPEKSEIDRLRDENERLRAAIESAGMFSSIDVSERRPQW